MNISAEPAPYIVLQSEYISREPWFTVRQERVQLSNGHIIPKYWVQEFPTWINVIAITTDNHFVLVRQYRHGIGRFDYELCAGVMEDEKDASPLDAAKRELLEETGYSGGHWQEWMIVSANPATQNNLTYCYLATDVTRTAAPNLDAGEQLIVELFSVEEVKTMLQTGAILQALHAAPLWKFVAEQMH